ncbi:MAG TPA: HAD family hydrolase [Candidatus Gemmiger excrementavium]|uniref:HAD family hydrolase n=1 Tax=Candidatus Gemmiger excrementavium TaxID=2838608 RepID=A0A9D2F2C0_9FIRM|nr:HAD family hydrolase [Candidatus Gemmiger excrementavium]
MYTTVLFDLDGTLLNTIDDLADSANRVCAAHGWPTHEVAQYRYFVGNGIPKLVERFTPEPARDPATLAAALAEFDTVYGAHMYDKTAPYPGMPDLLARLKAKGVRMAVFSNKADKFAGEVVTRYFDPNLFEIIRGARPGVPTKPAPEGTRALLQHLGVDAQSGTVLYVGDSNVDVATAHNAGLPCCGVLWGFRTRQELQQAGAEYLAADTQELERVILGE